MSQAPGIPLNLKSLSLGAPAPPPEPSRLLQTLSAIGFFWAWMIWLALNISLSSGVAARTVGLLALMTAIGMPLIRHVMAHFTLAACLAAAATGFILLGLSAHLVWALHLPSSAALGLPLLLALLAVRRPPAKASAGAFTPRPAWVLALALGLASLPIWSSLVLGFMTGHGSHLPFVLAPDDVRDLPLLQTLAHSDSWPPASLTVRGLSAEGTNGALAGVALLARWTGMPVHTAQYFVLPVLLQGGLIGFAWILAERQKSHHLFLAVLCLAVLAILLSALGSHSAVAATRAAPTLAAWLAVMLAWRRTFNASLLAGFAAILWLGLQVPDFSLGFGVVGVLSAGCIVGLSMLFGPAVEKLARKWQMLALGIAATVASPALLMEAVAPVHAVVRLRDSGDAAQTAALGQVLEKLPLAAVLASNDFSPEPGSRESLLPPLIAGLFGHQCHACPAVGTEEAGRAAEKVREQAIFAEPQWQDVFRDRAQDNGWTHLLIRKAAPHAQTIPLRMIVENERYAVYAF